MRRLRNFLAMSRKRLRLRANSSVFVGSSIIVCACSYVIAAALLMTLFVKRGFTFSSGNIVDLSTIQNAEKAKRSCPPTKEHMSVVSALGSISNRLCTKYVVVPRRAASSSMAVSGNKNEVTSAM